MKAWRGRYVLLVFDCMLVVGIYFCTDMPSALQSQIEGTSSDCIQDGSPTNTSCCIDCLGLGGTKYNLLYTIYSWTSSVMILPVGFIIDRLGNRVSALVFTAIATSGSLVFALASLASFRNTSSMFPLMMVGRLLLGMGTGSSRIVRDRVIACWFPDKLALAFGVAVSTMGLGSVLTFQLTANMAHWIGLSATLFVGSAICSTAFFSAICLCCLDVYGTRKHGNDKVNIRQSTKSIVSTIKTFPGSYWYICAMLATYYSFQLPFTANSTKFIQERYGYKETDSSYVNGALYDVSVILSPIAGIILHKMGNRGWVAFAGALATVPMGPLLLFTDVHPLVIYIWIGFMFTFTVVALWSAIPHVIPPSSLGSANGIASCMLDMGAGITSVLIGQIMPAAESMSDVTDDPGDCTWRYVFFLLFGYVVVCAVSGLLLNVMCNRKGICINAKRHVDRAQSNIGPVAFPDEESNKTIHDEHLTQDMRSIFNFQKDIVIENNSAKEWRKFSTKNRTDSKKWAKCNLTGSNIISKPRTISCSIDDRSKKRTVSTNSEYGLSNCVNIVMENARNISTNAGARDVDISSDADSAFEEHNVPNTDIVPNTTVIDAATTTPAELDVDELVIHLKQKICMPV